MHASLFPLCWRRRWRGALFALGSAAGCARAPTERLCPPLAAGELAITELAGARPDTSDLPWLELVNTTDSELELFGLRVRARRLDGGGELAALVRREVSLAPGGYAVLSLAADGARPSFASYGVGPELGAAWYPAAALQLESCEVLVDRVSHGPLPGSGALALAPAALGDAATRNDRAAQWCVAAERGSPGAENPPCR